jgi:hypothetical protein
MAIAFFWWTQARRHHHESHSLTAVIREPGTEPITLCLNHRLHTREQFKAAFANGRDLLFVTIMTQHTLKWMEPLFQVAAAKNARIRVLTWDPAVPPSAIEAFRLHLNENEHDHRRTVQQVKQASEGWDALSAKYSNIEVRRYRSSPTMQGLIVGDELAMIELLPYSTAPDDRPALILSRGLNPDAFALLRESFERLWRNAG